MKKAVRFLALAVAILCAMALVACGHTHTFGEWSETTAATCSAEGTETRVCECGEVETRSIQKLAHTYGSETLVIENGVAYNLAICEDCDAEKKTVNNEIMSLADEITFVTTAEELTLAMANGGFIVVVNDITSEGNFTVADGKTVTVHLLDGVTIEGDGCDGVFYVTNGALTLSGNGTVKSIMCPDHKYSMAVWAQGEAASVIINGNTYINTGYDGETQFDLIYASAGSQVEINGGVFDCYTPKWTLNLKDNTGASILVKGGSFYGFNPSLSDNEPVSQGLYSFVADGYAVSEETQNGVTVYTVDEE